MSDRIDPLDWPSPRGPWPEATDSSKLYDHGQPWCVNAAAHPDANDGYPDPERHLPWHECHGVELHIDGARRELDREPLGLSVYAAAPFRFGQPRGSETATTARIVIETWPLDGEDRSRRISIDAAQALRLARVLVHIADRLIFVGCA